MFRGTDRSFIGARSRRRRAGQAILILSSADVAALRMQPSMPARAARSRQWGECAVFYVTPPRVPAAGRRPVFAGSSVKAASDVPR